MATYDADGTITGSATVSGSASRIAALTEALGILSGGSSAGALGAADAVPDETLEGVAVVNAEGETLINVSGYLVGSGALVDARLVGASSTTFGFSSVTGEASRVLSVSGYSIGAGNFLFSLPDPMVGVAIVTAYLEVIKVPLPLCEVPTVQLKFRWGHTFTRGDLELKVKDRRGNPFGPVCVSYTLYWMQPGCALKQVGPSNRKPVQAGVGNYYVTGTAGECGQPGLWAVRWRYQKTFGEESIEKDCFFRVVDSISSPIPGDTLQRYCKKGWD